MEFLGIDKKTISNFQLLLLQTEVDKAFVLFLETFSRFSMCIKPFSTIIWNKWRHLHKIQIPIIIIIIIIKPFVSSFL